jgi:DNA-binding beta-propeller fold protein YncE
VFLTRLLVFLATALLVAAPAKSQPIELIYPNGLALNRDGNIYISDIGAHRVLKLDRQQKLSLIAGTGEAGFSGDGGPATEARLSSPMDLAFDADGNLLVADTFNHRIRRIDSRGLITTIVGDGKKNYSRREGSALEVSLNNPQSLALDRDGNLFIADTYNFVVRKIDRTGKLTTVAGTEAGLAGDKGPATKAQLNLPQAVAIAPDGTIYISDSANSRIRRVGADGIIETIAGSGPGSGEGGAGFAGDGQAAAKAKLFSPTDLKFNSAGHLYIADSGNNRIRLIKDGLINTIAGGSAQDLKAPQKIALGPDESIYISDRVNHRVLKIDSKGAVATIAGGTASPGILVDPSVLRLEKPQNRGE